MKTILTMALFVAAIFVSHGAGATITGGEAPKTKKHLSTNVNFEDQLVNGKYAYPDEAVATVEDEKVLNDLLGVRKDFKDRLKQTAERR